MKFNEKVQHDLLFVEAQKTKEPDGSALLTGITRAKPAYIKREMFPANLSELGEEAIAGIDDVTDNVDVRPQTEKDIWQHMIDVCTRFSQVRIVPRKRYNHIAQQPARHVDPPVWTTSTHCHGSGGRTH